MDTIEIPEELGARLSNIAAELPEFESTEELVEYVLESTATELERELEGKAIAGEDSERPDDAAAVEERLEDLGYL